MTLKQAKKEHKEHQKDLKPLLKHLRSDEKKIAMEPKKSVHELPESAKKNSHMKRLSKQYKRKPAK